MTSNGSANQTGLLSVLSSASKSGTQRRPSLPAFVSTSRAQPTDRPRGAGGRLKSWDHLSTDQVIRHGAKAAAQANAGRRVDLLGNLMMLVFIGLAIGMAAVTIHQEEQLAPRERQLLQQQR